MARGRVGRGRDLAARALRRAAGVLASVLAAACDAPASELPAELTRVSAELPGGAGVTLDFGESARAFGGDGRFGWELADGTRVTLQSVAAMDAMMDDGTSTPRTPSAVAAAIAERLALGDAEGELSHRPCGVGGSVPPIPGECVLGTQTDSRGVAWTRRGVVFAAGTQLVWLDVASETAATATDREAEVRASVIVEGAP